MNLVPFSELELTEPLRRAVEEMGFETATEIQAQTIPLLRQGKDVIGRSQTGTGKTLAFGIPAVESIDTSPEKKGRVQVLILCPTRELSMQACDEIRKLAKFRPGVKTVDIYGGAPMARQIMALRAGANIVVGTPGRIMDHLRRRTLKLDGLHTVILDEADEMLSMGFKEDIETILTDVPSERQTVLFSATMPPAILMLTKEFQRDPQLVEIDRKQPSVKAIRQCYYEVPMGRKMDALSLILYAKDPQLCIIFSNTKKMTDELSEYLKTKGFKAEGLHGDMKQAQRTQVLNAFKSRAVRILVATDVAARGIDVNDIDYVINYDIPQDVEYYIHRIGRTGRAGKAGNAITLCSGRKQAVVIGQIARMTKSDIVREPLPTAADVQARMDEAHLAQLEETIRAAQGAGQAPDSATPEGQAAPEGRGAAESHTPLRTNLVDALEQKGYDARAIAAAAISLLYGRELPQLPVIEGAKPRFGGDSVAMGKITLNVGRANRVAPNHIVGAIADMTELSGKDIGKIEIYDNRTVVGIPQASVKHVVEVMRHCKICGQNAEVSLYAGREAPAFGARRPQRDLRPKEGRKPERRRDGHAKPYDSRIKFARHGHEWDDE